MVGGLPRGRCCLSGILIIIGAIACGCAMAPRQPQPSPYGYYTEQPQPAAEDRAERERLARELADLKAREAERAQKQAEEAAAREKAERERLAQELAAVKAKEEATARQRQMPLAAVKNRWAVVIGMSKYQFAEQGALEPLAFADKDAKDFAETLKAQGWSPDHVQVLTNEQATKQNVTYALETWLRRAGPEDIIVLFWAGHGWPDPEDPSLAYFACYDSKPSDPSSCWRMDRVRQILEERKARNVVVIADTCHAGKVIRSGDARAISVVPALDAMEKKKDIPNGWVFIVSADPDRKAYEDKAWSNGALTHVLLEGMRDGKADGYKSAGAKDGTVTLGELRVYITDRMAEESLNLLGARLTPLFFTTSGNPEIWNLSLKGGM